jgi:hypothetical protein
MNVGDKVEVTVTFERVPDFSSPFQWRNYDVMIERPSRGIILGVPVTMVGTIVGVHPTWH